jgi:hypothetical protein
MFAIPIIRNMRHVGDFYNNQQRLCGSRNCVGQVRGLFFEFGVCVVSFQYTVKYVLFTYDLVQ